MAVEAPLNRVIRRQLFENKVRRLAIMQQFIPYHIDQLSSADTTTRREFRYIQVWYTRVLNLSLDQVRAYMHLVDIRELQGFSVEPITRKDKPEEKEEVANNVENDDEADDEEKNEDSENASDNDHSADNNDYDYNMPQDDVASLMRPEAILRDMGFRTREDFESRYGQNNVVVPSNPQETERSQAGTYDQDGFYVGEESTEPEEEPITRPGLQRSVSWADEVEDALETGQLQPPGLVSDDSSPASDFEASSSLSQPSSSSSNHNESLSKELRNLLGTMGVGANMRRSNTVVTLTMEEWDEAESAWAYRVSETEKIAFVQRGRRPYEESVEEKDLLDTFDESCGLFYWQKEGLFLCRLTELVYKESFEQARPVWWIEVNLGASYVKRKKPLPSSPLKNEVFMDQI
ncbi:hypothetical protein FHL15_007463 [Xylaria flabelliformis]|uniref:Uncharacterized protein n=1 Tax=Xylaria flabelliformis TaxID=2512241 RepID=A0A553HUQ8_9PEZI|nr:hypothetical protein FHL15_007463 [Xylaria flabelliformis]